MHTLEHKITPLFLLKFTFPTVVMMIFNAFYTMVDGVFVSNFISTDALSAVNIVYPLSNIVLAIGIMLATGGSAIVAKQMGEATPQKARQSFSFLTSCGIIISIIIALIGILFTKQLVLFLGANDTIYSYCYDYAFYISLFTPFAILQLLFQYFFVTAGKPNLGLITTVIGGISNIVFDYIFIVPLNMGIKGAAIATGIGFTIPAIVGLVYFLCQRNSSLYFVKPIVHIKTLIKACTNGSSEMISNLSIAVTTVLFNLMMMNYLGEDGVAAITIVLYAQFLFTAVFLGYTSGVAPLFSYNYGAQNTKRLKKLFHLSILFIIVCSVLAFCSSILLKDFVVGVFAKSNTDVFDLATQGMDLFAFGFLLMGINIFASGLFTSLSNGKVSAILSFLRTFVFILAAILVLPSLFGVNGIWISIPVAETLALVVSVWYMIKLKSKYQY